MDTRGGGLPGFNDIRNAQETLPGQLVLVNCHADLNFNVH